MEIKTKLLRAIYDNGWVFEEDDARDLGLEFHLEFLNLISSGMLQREMNGFDFNGEDIVYKIPEYNRKEILEFLVREYKNSEDDRG